jgi:hypothetical protein
VPLTSHDDGNFENAVVWIGSGVVQDGAYGSWAQAFDADTVCGIQFVLTQVGDYAGQTMDVYLWEAVGIPPVPGNVIARIPGYDPGAPAEWPEVSLHEIRVCVQTDGFHFAGFWPNWPGSDAAGWFVAADEDTVVGVYARTKIAPGIGYPTGWQDPRIVPSFAGVQALGIREYAQPGECTPSAVRETTWGRIRALYRSASPRRR